MSLSAIKISEKYEVGLEEAKSALNLIQDGNIILFAVSGKMGSGKDTIGDKVCEGLGRKGYKLKSIKFSDPIREEIQEIVSLEKDFSVKEIAGKFNVSYSEIKTLKSLLGESSVYQRTSGTRKAAQYWGADVRRKHDPNYWTKKLAKKIIELANLGCGAYTTGARFVSDLDLVLDIGGKVVRLEVPENIRIARIFLRDGIKPSKEHLNHVSETTLDNYKFDRVFDGTLKPTEIACEVEKYVLNE